MEVILQMVNGASHSRVKIAGKTLRQISKHQKTKKKT